MNHSDDKTRARKKRERNLAAKYLHEGRTSNYRLRIVEPKHKPQRLKGRNLKKWIDEHESDS